MALLMFDPAHLQKAIDQAVPKDLPDGHTSALVGAVDANGVQVVLAVRKNLAKGTLEADGVWQRTWTGDQNVGARVIYSF